MPSWSTLAAQAPDLAVTGGRLLGLSCLEDGRQGGLAYLATLTARGAPRLQPISPCLVDGHLCLAVIAGTPKRADLSRDGRMALHAPLGAPNDEEFVVVGRAFRIPDQALAERVRRASPLRPDAELEFFEVDIERCLAAEWIETDAGPRPRYCRWPDAV